MKVGELITVLQRVDPSLNVFVEDSEYRSWNDIRVLEFFEGITESQWQAAIQTPFVGVTFLDPLSSQLTEK